jgi:hypothetical protein
MYVSVGGGVVAEVDVYFLVEYSDEVFVVFETNCDSFESLFFYDG